MKSASPVDSAISQFDAALRTLAGVTRAIRPNPAKAVKETSTLTEEERRTAGRLMRVNHCGEICAQALYLGQGLTSSNPATQQAMQQAAQEESDHLAWCEDRLEALDTHKSYLNPLFFAASFAGGAVTGLISDQVNLGLVAATEERVIDHLEAHLEQLPQHDNESRAILEQMKQDEDTHRTTALNRGGADFPAPVKNIMTLASKVMTKSTYWI
ncbi:MAG: 2-polyprenyl-3-methyl-6-methoxy-1,4-benzoquinone monooxygenase [Gammaproteobacteria bacterium]